MPVDFNRILTVLNTAGISRSDPAIYQAIASLIQYARENQASNDTAIAAASSGSSNIANNGSFLTWTNQASSFLNSRELLAGTGVTFDDTVANKRTINASAEIPVHWVWKDNLTDTEFKALPSTYIELVATPGSNKTLVPLWAYFLFLAFSGSYTNVDPPSQAGLTIAYGDWDVDCYGFIPFTGAPVGAMLLPMLVVPDAAALAAQYPGQNKVFLATDKPLKLVSWNPSGDYTGGGVSNTFKIGVAYTILDVSTGEFS